MLLALALALIAHRTPAADLPPSLFEELASMRSAGDVDRDGTGDVLVPFRDSAGIGQVRVLSGADGSVLLRLTGASAGDGFGYSMASVGDLDGDGYPEIAVGARGGVGRQLDENGNELMRVRHDDLQAYVRVFSGKDGRVLREIPHVFIVASAGDFDGDGRPEILLGGGDGDRRTDGEVLVYSVAKGKTLLEIHPAGGPGPEAREPLHKSFSASCADLGVLDPGGSRCIVVAEPEFGPIENPRGRAVLLDANSGKSRAETGETLGPHLDGLGSSLALAGDLDGDGVVDLLLGAPKRGVRAVSGRTLRTLFTIYSPTIDDPTWGFATNLDVLPDIDGRGRPDIVVGADKDPGLFDVGLAYVYSGEDGELIRKLHFSERDGVEVCTLRDPKGNSTDAVALRIRTRNPENPPKWNDSEKEQDVLRIVSARDGKTLREFDLRRVVEKPPASKEK